MVKMHLKKKMIKYLKTQKVYTGNAILLLKRVRLEAAVGFR